MFKPLQIDITPSEIVPRVTIMRLEGDLSNDTIDSLNKSFVQLVSDKRLYVVADMSGVSSFSSSALGELMGGRTILVEQGGNLVLTGLCLDLMTKFDVLGAHKIFTVYNDLRSALAAYTWQYDRHTEQIECSFPPQICLAPAVRHFVGRVARQKGFGERDAFRIETIVDEVCNNAVEHGSGRPEHAVNVGVSMGLKKVEVKVSNVNNPDTIVKFKELSKTGFAMPLSPSDDRRGRGLSLVKMLSDSMSFNFQGDGTTVHITKLKREE